MKFKHLAVAAAALVAGSAFAQSNVTLYGLIDEGVRFSNNNAGGNKWELSEGAFSGSRWGLRGTEDLGGGLKGVFTLESGFSPDTGASQQGGRLFGRQAFVGLGGGFGTVTLGRQYTLGFETLGVVDPIGIGNVGSNSWYVGMLTNGVRWDNAVKYSGSFGGLNVGAMYSFGTDSTSTTSSGEVAGKTSAGRGLGVSASYAFGPAVLGASYGTQNNNAGDAMNKTILVGGTYAIGPVALRAAYANLKDVAVAGVPVVGSKVNGFMAAADYQATPALKLTLGGVYAKGNDTLANSKQYTVIGVADYMLSKRTDVYLTADYNKGKNDNSNAAADMLGANLQGLASGKTAQTTAMVGVRHRF